MSEHQEPPSGVEDNNSSGEGTPPDQPVVDEPPPYSPDPDLITFLEREAKPGEVTVWHPTQDD